MRFLCLLLSLLLTPLSLAQDVWTDRTGVLPSGRTLQASTHANGEFFVFSGGTFWTSAAGTTGWTRRFFPGGVPRFFNVTGAASSPTGTVVVSGTKNAIFVAQPDNPYSFTQINLLTDTGRENDDITSVRYLNGQFVVGTEPFEDFSDYNNLSYSEIFTSPDGVTWTSHRYIANTTENFAGDIVDGAYSPVENSYTFVTGTGIVFTAPGDLSTMSATNFRSLRDADAITYGAGKFVLVTGRGAIWSRANSGNWMIETPPAGTNALEDILYDGSQFIAVGAFNSSATPRRPTIVVSTNGSMWTIPSTIPETDRPLNTIAFDGTVHVLGGDSATLFTSGSSSLSAPTFMAEPAATTGTTGDAITLTTSVDGSSPLTYEWRRNGVVITDGGRISGATSDSLSIAAAELSDAGSYTVTVSNSLGTITSAPASLTLSASAGGATLTPLGTGTFPIGILAESAPVQAVFREASQAGRRFTVGSGSARYATESIDGATYIPVAVSPGGKKVLLKDIAAFSGRPDAVLDVTSGTTTLLPTATLPLGSITSIRFYGGFVVSDNGDVGGSFNDQDSNLHAYYYSSSSGTYTLLGNTPNSTMDRATSVGGITADGSLLSGYERINAFNGPYHWSPSSGFTALPSPENGGFPSGDVRGISADGRFTVGFGTTPAQFGSGRTALRWDRGAPAGAPVGRALRKLNNHNFADAFHVTTDGTVGGLVREFDGTQNAAVWTPSGALVQLSDYLLDTYGLDLGSFPLSLVTDISEDGRTLMGNSFDGGTSEAWLLTLPAPITVPDAPELTVRYFSSALATGADFTIRETVLGATNGAEPLTIANLGTSDLTGLSFSLSGADAGDFSLSPTPPATIEGGFAEVVTVTHVRSTPGTSAAVLTISSNDPTTPSFTLNLTGTARERATVIFENELAALGIPASLRGPEDDADTDGISNALELALGLDPNSPTGSDGITTGYDGINIEMCFTTARPDIFRYQVESTTDITDPDSWVTGLVGVFPPNPTTGKTLARFFPSGSKGFLRLSVTLRD